jgi:hypothetical protein
MVKGKGTNNDLPIFQTKFKKVKHATPRNKWPVCWSSSSIARTYKTMVKGKGTNNDLQIIHTKLKIE